MADMSATFSGTHLRVPRGWGALLEGLAREILRDQPEDIPRYAAQHLRALLKLREDCGMDYTKWDARQEARFYNSRAFKTPEPRTEKEPATEESISKEKSCDPQTEDESSLDASNLSTTQPDVTEEVELIESTGEEEEEEEDEDDDVGENHITAAEQGVSEEEAVSEPAAADTQSDELSCTKEDRDPGITILDKVEEGTVSVLDQDKPQSEVEPSDMGMSNVDICAQELDTAVHEGDNKQETAGVDAEISESEEETQAEEPPEVLPYPGLADVDVCAAELEGREVAVETSPEDDTRVIEEDGSKPGPGESAAQSPLPQYETPESNERQTEDQAEETVEDEGTEPDASSGGIHESLTHTEDGLGSNMTPNEDALVEISFEDVPEAQQIKEVEERQPEDEESAEALKILDSQQAEEFKEVIAEAIEHHTETGTQENNETNMETVGEEFQSEAEESENQDTSDIVKETVDTANTDLNNSEDDEKEEGIKTFSSSHELSSEVDRESSGDVNYHKNEETEEISEGETPQNESNDQDAREDETTATVGGAEEDVETEGQQINEGGAEDHSPGVMEAESESLGASAAEENKESQGALVESQPDAEKEVTTEVEGLSEEEKEGKSDSEIQETSDALREEGAAGPVQSADGPAADHQEEGGPPGSEDAPEPEGHSRDKQEDCSRPQEEEDIMDIPLDDPEANRAAAKIQAGFRGHMTRKKMKPEDKAEGEEVSSTGDVLNGSQGDTETGGSGPVEGDDTSVPEQ